MDIEYLSRHKERYFRKAEKYIRRAGLEEVLQVNRDTIGLYRNQTAAEERHKGKDVEAGTGHDGLS